MSSVADDFGNAAAKGGGGKKQDSGRTNQLFHELPIFFARRSVNEISPR